MNRTAVIVAVAIAALVAIACGANPVQVCKDQGTADCQKMWTCDAGAKLGTSQADCVSTYQALCSLVADGKCPSGAAFDVAHAQACVTDTNNASCADYLSGSYKAANCTPAQCK